MQKGESRHRPQRNHLARESAPVTLREAQAIEAKRFPDRHFWQGGYDKAITGVVASFTGDGGYDQDSVSAAVAERHPEAAVIVPPRATAVPSETAETAPTQRDRHLQHIAEHGRAVWQKASGYTMRARAEAAIGRFKPVIGDGLRSRTDDRRETEVDIAVRALNRMSEFGRPNYVRIA